MKSQMQYQVLLLLTDGAITDMPATREAIVEASEHPCSIIIVGVGNANFDAMNELDCDDGLLAVDPNDPRSKKAKRDIVQFVPFVKAMQMGNLAEQVLKEMPNQVEDYGVMTNWTAPVQM